MPQWLGFCIGGNVDLPDIWAVYLDNHYQTHTHCADLGKRKWICRNRDYSFLYIILWFNSCSSDMWYLK
ncbi:hypothetical protein J6590_102965 [Homalodisca vitripennis]|nr:hypothetical protein J6590_102965 [Homalodisca vitripennis]